MQALWMAALLPLASAASNGVAPCELQRFEASDGFGPASVAADLFGAALAVDGMRALIGAPGAKAAYVFEHDPIQGWFESAKLPGSNPVLAVPPTFGRSVALAGPLAWIGDPGDEGDAGRVSLFELGASGWSEAQVLAPSDSKPGDRFGVVAAFDDDLVVGAGGADGAASDTGAAYVFEPSAGGGWAPSAKLALESGVGGDRFGQAVAMARDTIVVGAPFRDAAGESSGAAYVYERVGGAWTRTAELAPSLAGGGQWFGAAVATDGARVAVAAPFGFSLYVYERGASGWVEVARVDAPPSFSPTLALSGDQLLYGHGAGLSPSSKAARLYERVGGSWGLAALFGTSFQPGPSVTYCGLGSPVAFAGDTVLVGGQHNCFGFISVQGSVSAFGLEDDACPGLVTVTSTPAHVSLTQGGAQSLSLEAGAFYAGDPFVVLGSASGTAPGLDVGGALLPLNADGYLLLTLLSPFGWITPSTGLLDAGGAAQAQVSLPPGLDPALLGSSLHHACLVLHVKHGLLLSVAASNASELMLGAPGPLLDEDFESGAPGWTFQSLSAGLWHLAEDGECSAVSAMAAYDPGPAACTYDAGPLGFHAGVLVSPPFAVDGEPPYSLSFTSRCVLSSLAGTTAFVYLEDLDDGSQATLASKNDLESNNFVQHTFALPLETEPRGKLFRLRFQVSAVTTATNPFYWLVDDVSVTALLP